jgi:NAD(P)H-dependent flavin oxidoreductase YrpB (nitropropane dioxygenase family)
VRDRLVAAEKQGDHDYWLMWFAQSVGLVAAVRPAGDVVREIVGEAEQILGGRSRTLEPSATMDAATRGGAAR